MASQADRVLRNFSWRIRSISPTHQRPGKRFAWYDPRRLDDRASPVVRLFNVRWLGDEDDGSSVTDMVERRAAHRFRVDVLYPDEHESMLQQEIILQDRHDLIKTLRDDRLWVGTGSDDPTADIGLKSRRNLPSELIDDDTSTSVLRMFWECEIWETE